MRSSPTQSTVIFPTPAGSLFVQKQARELAGREHLIFCCGRYEGIDQRVIEYTRDASRRGARAEHRRLRAERGRGRGVAVIEAVGRLIPGVVGNPESLVEESHEDGLLEYPSYTKPAEWRGLETPAVLLGGNHAAIAAWRHEQQLERTAARPTRAAQAMSSRGWWLAQLWVGLAMGVIAIAARLALAIGGAAVAEITTIPLAVTAAVLRPGTCALVRDQRSHHGPAGVAIPGAGRACVSRPQSSSRSG